MWNSFSPLIHINISQEQQRDKKNQWLVKQSKLFGIQTSFQRRRCAESDRSTATTRFWSCVIPINSVLFMTMSTQSNTQHIVYSAPNIKENTENMYNRYAKYQPFCLLDRKEGVALESMRRRMMKKMHCTCFYVIYRWDLNFAFYLRCSHIGQQRMNQRQDNIKRI